MVYSVVHDDVVASTTGAALPLGVAGRGARGERADPAGRRGEAVQLDRMKPVEVA
jgi:hypothetical protein